MFATIAWATDGSAAASEALPFVEGLARATDATLTIIHVQEVTISRAGFLVEDNRSVLASLDRTVRRLRDGGIHATVLSSKAPTRDVPRTILDLAGAAAADALVVGNRGHGSLINLVLGSVTDRLLQIASLPIIVVPLRPAVATPLVDAQVAAVSTRSGRSSQDGPRGRIQDWIAETVGSATSRSACGTSPRPAGRTSVPRGHVCATEPAPGRSTVPALDAPARVSS